MLATILSAGVAFAAEITESPLVPMNPMVAAQGSSFIANTRGLESFFYNPAGFSRDGGSLSIDIGAWLISRPDLVIDAAGKAMGGNFDTAAILDFASTQVTTGGVGAGSSLGIGWTKDGLGLGMVVIVDSLLTGPSLLGLTGDFTSTIGFVGGLSAPFNIFGVTLHVGGQIRPMIRIHAPLTNADAVGMVSAFQSGGDAFAALFSANAVYGAGIGLDLGTIAEIAGFSAGISLRDIAGTRFKFNRDTYGNVMGSFTSKLKFPTGTTVTSDTYIIPMNLSAGLAYHPDLGNLKFVVDPSISVDVQDLINILTNKRSPWTLLHVGFEIKTLNMFALRAGLNQGYITLGGGMRFAAFNADLAVFTRELGTYLGDKPSSGASLSISLRF
jgi:hypothetical protein